MTDATRTILVTTALPYANGPLHLGYMVEAVQADIWVRFQKLIGNTCHFVCADDAHGTPVMLLAESRHITPEALIQEILQSHIADLQDFQIGFDHFHTTHCSENQQLAELIYDRLRQGGDIVTRTIAQAFDPIKNLFLPDRYVKGDCPQCSATNQYGDNCEQCGATYSPMDLKNPISILSGVTPIQRESEHYFFCLDHYQDFLKQWIKADHVQAEMQKKLLEWFEIGLEPWNISRDAPYFGFKIPNTENKYFYVWLDAPIGYIASFKHYCENKDLNTTGIEFEAYWKKDSQAELYHFIGKDIIYFHGLFWPAILKSADFRTPTHLFVHGFLTVNGQKMSKSRGTFIEARRYLDHLKPEYLRYYFASKSNGSIEDLDFQNEDFVSKVNADLVGKWANIASRCAGFIHQHFKGCLSDTLHAPEKAIYESFVQAGESLNTFYEARTFNRATQLIMQLADEANRYIDQHKPWILAKSPENKLQLWQVCSLSLNLFRLLTLYLSPIVPSLALQAAQFLKSDLQWQNRHQPLIAHAIASFEPLIQRIELKTVEALMNQITESNIATEKEQDPIEASISIDEFNAIDLRVGKIIQAEAVPEADKLIKLQIDLGEGRSRQIFAGIKQYYPPEDLVGKWVAVVANLAPRKMRFGISEGMLLATSGPDGSRLWLIEPNPGTQPGTRIK